MLEQLESRRLLSTAPIVGPTPLPAVLSATANTVTPLLNVAGNPLPSSSTPARVGTPTAFNQTPLLISSTALNDSFQNAAQGQTIAMGDPHGNPNITSDLAASSTASGLPLLTVTSGTVTLTFSLQSLGGGNIDQIASTLPAIGTSAANNLVPALSSFNTAGSNAATNAVASSASIIGSAQFFDSTTSIILQDTFTPTPGSQTQTPTTTQPVIVVIPIGTTTLANSHAFIVLIGPANLPTPTVTNSAATHAPTFATHSGLSILTEVPTTPVRPPQSLGDVPDINYDLPWLTPIDEEAPPLYPEWTTPPFGPEIIVRDAQERLFDLLAIARTADAMGRLAENGDVAEGPGLAPLTEPIPTDLTVRDATPALDPFLAGAVVVVGGTLALRHDRTGTRRRWSIRPDR